MQGYCPLVWLFCWTLQSPINSPAAVSLRTRPTYFLTALTLAYGWLDANHKSVGLVLRWGWHFDGGLRKRYVNCGQLSALLTSREVALLSGRHKFTWGKHCSSFVTSWDVSHQKRCKLFLGIILACATGVAYSALLRVKILAERSAFTCLVRFKSSSRFGSRDRAFGFLGFFWILFLISFFWS